MAIAPKVDQLGVLTDSVDQLGRTSEPIERYRILSNAIQRIGFSEGYRFGVARHLEQSRYEISDLSSPESLDSPIAFKDDNSIIGQTLATGSVCIIGNLFPSNIHQFSPLQRLSQSAACIPAFRNGQPKGVLFVDCLDRNGFTHDAISALAPYAALIGSTLLSEQDKKDLVALIAESKKKQVLILGKDNGPEFARLLRINDIVKELGYDPLLVKQHPDIPELSNEEKMRVFADHARFVILENSFPAGQIAELKICSTNRMITATLREKGKGSSFMVTDYHHDYKFITEFEYLDDQKSLRESVVAACKWAEERIEERIAVYNAVYPWRASALANCGGVAQSSCATGYASAGAASSG